jgi:hypothetical protein
MPVRTCTEIDPIVFLFTVLSTGVSIDARFRNI